MISFTVSAEQLRSAPPEVRRWIEQEVAAALGGFAREPLEPHAPSLSACTPEEALQVFEMIRGNFLLSQVFFELARQSPAARVQAPLHALDVAEILRHTRLADGDRLAECLSAINRAFQTLRRDGEASLFGFDSAGHVYIHETTHQSVRHLWEQLVAGHSAPPAMPQTATAPAWFEAPRLGPSEDIMAHGREGV